MTDDDFIRVASVADVAPGAAVDVEVDGEVVVLANVEGAIYAVGGWCPHLGTALALGSMSGHTLTCFAHLWRYDVRSGEPIWPPMARVVRGYALKVFRVRVVGEDVYVCPRPMGGGLG
ncbi:MAG TPA: Rieske 2Fe-2S domain-containing protein [Chloroflexota bacterium]|nr:Rieske 2Fe-2S domain-containing protein [Chloroflexota bacterium]